MALFQVLNNSKLIKEVRKSYDHLKRFSRKAAAQQKFLDSLYVEGATEGRIVEDKLPDKPLHFHFYNGKSSFYFPDEKESQS